MPQTSAAVGSINLGGELPTGWSFLTMLSSGCRRFCDFEPSEHSASGSQRNMEPISPLCKVFVVNISPPLARGKVWPSSKLKSVGWFGRLIEKQKVLIQHQTHQPLWRIPWVGFLEITCASDTLCSQQPDTTIKSKLERGSWLCSAAGN